MPTTVTLADLPSLKGEHLGTSKWLEVTQEMIDTFADATGDHQWIHVDPERAAAGPFGTTIAHGYLTLSLIPQLAPQTLVVEGRSMGVNYGLNRCRFPTPVPVGSRIRADVRLTDVTELDGGAMQTTTEVTINIQGSDKPACVAEVLSRYYP
jgi:acyl dehydratase